MNLLDIFAADAAEQRVTRTATVTSIAPLTVQFGGDASSPTLANIARLSSYYPAVGDGVICEFYKGRALILGSLTTQATPPPWTPALSGFTSVTVTTTGSYRISQGMCYFNAQSTIGTVITLGTAQITLNLPVATTYAPMVANNNNLIGSVLYRTSGAVVYVGQLFNQGTTAAGVRVPTSTTTSNVATWTGAVPAGQAATDVWSFVGQYPIA